MGELAELGQVDYFIQNRARALDENELGIGLDLFGNIRAVGLQKVTSTLTFLRKRSQTVRTGP